MSRFGVKEVANLTLYDLKTGEPALFLDSLKLTNVENSAEESFATGGQGGGRLIGWNYGRTAVFNVQDALLNPKAIAMQAGTELEKKVEDIYVREVLTGVAGATDTEVKLSHVPSNTVKLYITEDGYGHDTKIATADMVVTGDKVAVPNAVLADGKQVIAYYTRKSVSEAEIITISSSKFGGYYKAIGDTFWRNEANGEDEMVQIVIGKAKITSNFTLTMQPDGDPSVFDFNLDVFKEAGSDDMIKFIRYQ